LQTIANGPRAALFAPPGPWLSQSFVKVDAARPGALGNQLDGAGNRVNDLRAFTGHYCQTDR